MRHRDLNGLVLALSRRRRAYNRLPRWFRFWWTRTCLEYGHFAHRRRFGELSCSLWLRWVRRGIR